MEKRALGFFVLIARRVMRVTPREVSIVCAGWDGEEGAERDEDREKPTCQRNVSAIRRDG